MPTNEWRAENKDKLRKYRREWYAKNRTHAKEKIMERRARMRTWLQEHKSELKCSKCGESHIACIEFHHRNPAKKEINVSAAINQGWSKKRILLEISKCTVYCSNCHRKHHYKRV